MEKITKHVEATRQHATDAPFPFVPRAVTFLADAQKASRSLRVVIQSREEGVIVAKVISSVSIDSRQRIVKLWLREPRGECSCLVFQDMLMPCCHAQRVCAEVRIDYTV